MTLPKNNQQTKGLLIKRWFEYFTAFLGAYIFLALGTASNLSVEQHQFGAVLAEMIWSDRMVVSYWRILTLLADLGIVFSFFGAFLALFEEKLFKLSITLHAIIVFAVVILMMAILWRSVSPETLQALPAVRNFFGLRDVAVGTPKEVSIVQSIRLGVSILSLNSLLFSLLPVAMIIRYWRWYQNLPKE